MTGAPMAENTLLWRPPGGHIEDGTFAEVAGAHGTGAGVVLGAEGGYAEVLDPNAQGYGLDRAFTFPWDFCLDFTFNVGETLDGLGIDVAIDGSDPYGLITLNEVGKWLFNFLIFVGGTDPTATVTWFFGEAQDLGGPTEDYGPIGPTVYGSHTATTVDPFFAQPLLAWTGPYGFNDEMFGLAGTWPITPVVAISGATDPTFCDALEGYVSVIRLI